MQKNSNKINSKEKKFKGGNWGHPRPDIKKSTQIDNPLYPEIPKHKSNKKYKKKVKKEYQPIGSICPFCNKDLKVIAEEKIYWLKEKIYDNKCECGAKEVEDCPCCHRSTWFKDGIYQHNHRYFSFCTFKGRKK